MRNSRLVQLMAASMVMTGCTMASNDAASVRAGFGLSLDRVGSLDGQVGVAGQGAPVVPGNGQGNQPSAGDPTQPGYGGGAVGTGPTDAFVVSQAELPVAGATVTYPGGSATSDAAGHVTVPANAASGPVTIAKDGYATSVVTGGAATYHLRRNDGRTEPFEARTRRVTGHVTWPTTDGAGQPVSPRGGVVYYQDSLGTVTQPVALNGGTDYSFAVTAQEAGEPTGVVLVLAGDQTGSRTLLGASAPFKPFADEQPGNVTVAVADRAAPLDAPAAPSGLNATTWRLELVATGVPPIVISDERPVSSPLALPAPGALTGSLRVRYRAQSGDAQLGTEATVVPSFNQEAGSYGAVRATFLPVPSPFSISGSGSVTWSSTPGATAYRLSAQTDAVTARWEAWVSGGLKFDVSAADRSSWRGGTLSLEAIDAPGLTNRSVASLRQLRITPWLAEAAYRTSFRRIPL